MRSCCSVLQYIFICSGNLSILYKKFALEIYFTPKMASLKFLIISAVLVGAHAKFVWQDDDNFPSMPFKIQPPVPPTPPRRPFAPFPPFQPFAHFQPFAPFPPFAPHFQFPQIPMPQVLTPDQIRNAKPGPNQVFNGAVAKSESRMSMDKDGKWVRTGGISILSNQDGKVNEFKDGNAPPDITEPIKVRQPW